MIKDFIFNFVISTLVFFRLAESMELHRVNGKFKVYYRKGDYL